MERLVALNYPEVVHHTWFKYREVIVWRHSLIQNGFI